MFWAFIYNIIGIPVAAGLFFIPFALKLNPMIGAFAMILSSVFVVTKCSKLLSKMQAISLLKLPENNKTSAGAAASADIA